MSVGGRLRRLWRRLGRSAAGRRLFSWLLGRIIPYSGSLRARVVVLEAGRAVVELPDRRRVRNHLRSVHAIALANLGELATGLALHEALPEGMRGILVGYSIEYVKKARGTITASSTAPAIRAGHDQERVATAELRDPGGDLVARVEARWKLGPLPP